LRARLADAGFRPVAVFGPDANGGTPGKQPAGDAWQERARRDPPADAVAPPDERALNTGLLADGLRAVDIDIDDRTLAHELRALAVARLGETILRTRSNSGRCLLPYRAATGCPPKRTLPGNLGKIEVLGLGQQFVAFGIHQSGVPMSWYPSAPGDITVDALPAVTEQQLDEFFDAAAPLIGAERPAASPGLNGHTLHQLSSLGAKGDSLDVTAALATIPNNAASDWEFWNRIGLAAWAATSGSLIGFAAWCAWSERNPAHDPAACRERWEHYRDHPPTRSGAGTLFRMAKEARPGWKKPTEGGRSLPEDLDENPETSPHEANSGADPSQDLVLSPGAPLDSARRFIERHHMTDGIRTLHHQNASFYTWNHGHYVENTPEEMRAALYSFLDSAKRYDEDDKLVSFNPTKNKVANVLEAAAAEAQLPRSFQAPAWLRAGRSEKPTDIIACRNGLLHLPTRQLLAHTPDFFTTNALTFDYQSDAPKPTAWVEFLASIWKDDPEAIGTLQEFFGLCLTADTRHQKAFLIVGPKRSGKGTIARILTELLGPANVVGPTLSSLSQNFGLAPLIGKRLAIISDARLSGKADQQIIVERLLAVTGEDGLTVDRKFRDSWTGKPDARFLILTNELPRLADASGALASRFIVLVLTQSFFGKEDHGLTARLTRELPGILSWAIEGWERLTTRGNFVPPASSADAAQSLDDLGSPIGAFLRDRCIVSSGLVIAHPPAGRFTLTASPGHPPGPPAGPRARSGHATARWR
jgi:putative DNA primase/helicase